MAPFARSIELVQVHCQGEIGKVLVAGGYGAPADDAPMIDDASELDVEVGEEVTNS